ncbi:MAG: gliding motility-associated C-terminal domain-containing protein, partial [Cyclobacteriaceae bacterium]|nr:gliding motility-associated C-terminal domain-containing protein [Cyclobacteriaceae bacterium]
EVSGLLEGIYLFKFEATDNLGVSSSDEMKLVVLAAEVIVPNVPPTVDAGEDIVITLPENSVLISPFGSDADGMITEFLWRQVSGPLSAEMQFLPEGVLLVSNLIEGTYTFEVKVFDLDGANALDNVNVTVESEFAAVVPRNFFSPNGDGINDTWEIENYERLTDCLIEIYNLKGKLIFSEIGYQQSWDGSNNGAAVKSGVYYYFIRLKGTELIKSGTITLVK